MSQPPNYPPQPPWGQSPYGPPPGGRNNNKILLIALLGIAVVAVGAILLLRGGDSSGPAGVVEGVFNNYEAGDCDGFANGVVESSSDLGS